MSAFKFPGDSNVVFQCKISFCDITSDDPCKKVVVSFEKFRHVGFNKNLPFKIKRLNFLLLLMLLILFTIIHKNINIFLIYKFLFYKFLKLI